MGFNGAQIARSCAGGRPATITAKGFFEIFYRFSQRPCCEASRQYGTRSNLTRGSARDLNALYPRSCLSTTTSGTPQSQHNRRLALSTSFRSQSTQSKPEYATSLQSSNGQSTSDISTQNEVTRDQPASPEIEIPSSKTNNAKRGRPQRSLVRKISIQRSNPSLSESPRGAFNSPRISSPDIDHMSRKVRKLMRKIPHSVVVLTTGLPQTDNTQPGASGNETLDTKVGLPETGKGMTLSSFSTVTLDPHPIVSFNIRTPSTTLEALAKSKQCLVHVLLDNQDGARVAGAFTKGNAENTASTLASGESRPLFHGLGFSDHKGCLDPAEDTKLVPLLPKISDPGVGAVLHCLIHGKSTGFVEIGDHVVVFARVMKVMERRLKGYQFGLGYVDGKYSRVCETLDAVEGNGLPGTFRRVPRER